MHLLAFQPIFVSSTRLAMVPATPVGKALWHRVLIAFGESRVVIPILRAMCLAAGLPRSTICASRPSSATSSFSAAASASATKSDVCGVMRCCHVMRPLFTHDGVGYVASKDHG